MLLSFRNFSVTPFQLNALSTKILCFGNYRNYSHRQMLVKHSDPGQQEPRIPNNVNLTSGSLLPLLLR